MTYPVPSPAHTEAPISINFRIPEVPGSPQLTIRASQGVELEALTADVARHGHTVGKSLVDFRAGFLAGAGVQDVPQAPSQAPVQAPPSQSLASPASYAQAPAQQHQAPPQTGGTGPTPSCPHGQRVYKSGVSQKSGKPYKMWVCPAPQGDPSQCKPEWA